MGQTRTPTFITKRNYKNLVSHASILILCFSIIQILLMDSINIHIYPQSTWDKRDHRNSFVCLISCLHIYLTVDINHQLSTILIAKDTISSLLTFSPHLYSNTPTATMYVISNSTVQYLFRLFKTVFLCAKLWSQELFFKTLSKEMYMTRDDIIILSYIVCTC